jgi:hypothetical protein
MRGSPTRGPRPALQAILDAFQPSRALFIDDLPQHHGSVMEIAPHVSRLHRSASHCWHRILPAPTRSAMPTPD